MAHKSLSIPQSTYIYRVPHCMSPRRNWDCPTPSLASECAPPPGTKGGGAHSPAGEGLGESPFRRLEKKLSTLPTLCSIPSHLVLKFCSHSFSLVEIYLNIYFIFEKLVFRYQELRGRCRSTRTSTRTYGPGTCGMI